MGLDIALGVVVLIAALRGWFRGFWSQAIRLSALVGGVYAAGPLRDAALPVAREHLGSLDPGVLTRLLWWVAAIVSFLVINGVASGVVNLAQRRRRQEGLTPQHRGDQSAGVFLGAAKGALVACFLLEGLDDYTGDYIARGGWFAEQIETSRSLPLARQYQPAATLWNSRPVKDFVSLVQREGIGSIPDLRALPTSSTRDEAPDAQPAAPLRTARRPAPLTVPEPSRSGPMTEAEIERGLQEVAAELDRLRQPD